MRAADKPESSASAGPDSWSHRLYELMADMLPAVNIKSVVNTNTTPCDTSDLGGLLLCCPAATRVNTLHTTRDVPPHRYNKRYRDADHTDGRARVQRRKKQKLLAQQERRRQRKYKQRRG